MKIFFKALLLLCFVAINSCTENPVGYMGLKDNTPPEVYITGIEDGQVFSDSADAIKVMVQAYDFFGIKSVSLHLNYNACPAAGKSDSGYAFYLYTDQLKAEANNILSAGAEDSTFHANGSKKYLIRVSKTIIIKKKIDTLTIFDSSPPLGIDLNEVFEDTLTDNGNLIFQFEFTPIIIDASISENILTITPKKNFLGSSWLFIKARSGKRFNEISIPFNVISG